MGNISEMSTQQIGPHENMNEAEYIKMLIMVTSSNPAWPKLKATPKAPNAMPNEPVMSKGLRPHRSTVKMATKVKSMLTTPIITVLNIGLVIPMSPKIRGA